MGDSHVDVFFDPWLRQGFKRHFFNIHKVGGATASGLDNPLSRTQACLVFREGLRGSRARHVVVQLGEVDAGIVIWYRAQKHDTPVTVMLERAIETYANFLQEIRGLGFQVICISAPLPTIGDGVPRGEVAKARQMVKATQKQRSELTLEFNRRMAAKCAELDFSFIDLDPQSMGADGLVKSDLLSRDPADHHYERSIYARLLEPPLRALLEEANRA